MRAMQVRPRQQPCLRWTSDPKTPARGCLTCARDPRHDRLSPPARSAPAGPRLQLALPCTDAARTAHATAGRWDRPEGLICDLVRAVSFVTWVVGAGLECGHVPHLPHTGGGQGGDRGHWRRHCARRPSQAVQPVRVRLHRGRQRLAGRPGDLCAAAPPHDQVLRPARPHRVERYGPAVPASRRAVRPPVPLPSSTDGSAARAIAQTSTPGKCTARRSSRKTT